MNSETQAVILTTAKAIKYRAKIHPAALAWIKEHHQQLKSSGWTAPELWRLNRSKGLAWARTWARPWITVELTRDGSIVFMYTNSSGNRITQTAFPRRKRHGF